MLENLEPPLKKTFCGIRNLFETLEEKDVVSLKKALDNPDWTSKGLARELKRRGILISETPIMRHRRGECSC